MQMGSHTATFWERIGAQPESSAPLGIFRILFGLMVAGELAWYWLARPFMQVYYFDTTFHFSYPGFPQLPFLNGLGMKIFVVALAFCFLLFAFGLGYRIVKWICCFGFAYLFFLERAAFLNHWYLTLLICVLMLWIPANVRFSLDVKFGWTKPARTVPSWMRLLLVSLCGLVYLLSGLGKIEPDWISGRTMDLVLQSISGSISHVPDPEGIEILGAWGIILLELAAWPLLLLRRTRLPMLLLLLAFHLANIAMFTIGFFPLVMILLTLLFVADWWQENRNSTPEPVPQHWKRPVLRGLLVLFFALQIFLPLRHHFYPGNTLWTEEGRLFSWDMFLAFKGGEVSFVVQNQSNGSREVVLPEEAGLTWGQANKIFKSPDMILQFAHYLGGQRSGNGTVVKVFANSSCSLNARISQPLVHQNLDLYARDRTTWRSYPWVMPLIDVDLEP
jgi:hypothetical protein